MTPAAAARHRKVCTFLSLVLRHQPERIGLVLAGEGWADLDADQKACQS